MTPVGTLVLGLGLFFLGMQLAGENLRRLSSASYHPLGSRLGGSPWAAGLLGIAFGAMMQSATAVTFVTASMVGSGVMRADVARPVIVWSNVGLTVLAFLATLSIHNLVAVVVGLSGIAAGLLRRNPWHAAALLALGLSLILFGLQVMSEAVAPVRDQAWFQRLLDVTAAVPPAAFAAGVLIAMLLQSNTGATLLIIALAGAGTFTLPQAMLLIYGTNLGAIALRAVLAAELTGTARQLVRLEDLFCLWSGLLMGALYALEFGAGVPLVAALVRDSGPLPLQLALVFLLSNLLPALTLTPALGWCAALLARLWPPAPGEHAAVPRYLTGTALADPGTALELLAREIARLFDHQRSLLSLPAAERERAAESATTLAARIEGFVDDLSAGELSARNAARLTTLRDALSSARLLLESALTLARAVAELPAGAPAAAVGARLRDAAGALIGLAGPALTGDQPSAVAQLREQARAHGPFVGSVRGDCLAAGDDPALRLALLAVVSDFERVAWVLHRLAKTAKTP